MIYVVAHWRITTGRDRLHDKPRKSSFHRGDFANHAHGIFCRQDSVFVGHVAVWGNYRVSGCMFCFVLSTSLFCVHNFCLQRPHLLYHNPPRVCVLHAWVKHVQPQQPPKDADEYERVALDNIEITKESDTKPKLE